MSGAEKYAHLPEELKKSSRWVNYQIVEVDKNRKSKIPYSAKTKQRTDITNPDGWASFGQAVTTDPEHVGLVIGAPYVGIDLDHCRDPKTGQVEGWAQQLIDELNSYTELSPSGTGFHVWLRGIPKNGKFAARKDGIEIYARDRFFTVTGDHVIGTPPNVRELDAPELDRLIARVEAGRVHQVLGPSEIPHYTLRPKTRELLAFDPAGKPDQSGPVSSLLTSLMIDTVLDEQETERLFKSSPLYTSPDSHWGMQSKDKKWERLREQEIQNARNLARPAIAAMLRGRIPPEPVNADTYLELFHTYDEMVNAKPLRFVIQDFLQADGATMIGGLSGHGKTLTMLAVAKALLEGGSLFDYFKVVEPSTRVIYLIPEVPVGPFFHRLSKMFRLDEFLLDGRLLVRTLSKGQAVSLVDPRILKAAEGADVFLDTAIRFMQGDENQASDNQNGLAQHIFQLQAAGARTVVGAHHSPKGLEKETRLTLENVLRGSGDIGAMLATCWAIRQLDPERNRIWVQNVKPRDFNPPQPFEIEGRPHLDQTGYFRLVTEPGQAGRLDERLGNGKPGRKPGPRKEENRNLVLRLKSEGKSERDIAEETGIPRSTVHRLLTEPPEPSSEEVPF